ncbi:hypothetical protein [Trueperella bernardiae]|uniref:hypothetical protein n=1 Tax=Trueperella bernardiae TaxID=59561 RepID=UPI00288B33E4|nr:hypothetical protein [Trueperella bernardiae]
MGLNIITHTTDCGLCPAGIMRVAHRPYKRSFERSRQGLNYVVSKAQPDTPPSAHPILVDRCMTLDSIRSQRPNPITPIRERGVNSAGHLVAPSVDWLVRVRALVR